MSAPPLARPPYGSNGVKTLTTLDGPYADMLQHIAVHRLAPGETREWMNPACETALALVEGEVELQWEGHTEALSRASFLYDGPYCLHVPAGVRVQARAFAPCEILEQATENPAAFAPVLYTPQTTNSGEFGQNQFDGKALRRVHTFFDYASAPYSHMVCGEIIVPQGGWSSYPPHHHPQPEVYYYRFGRPQGFGACFMGDEVYKITDGSFAAIPGGQTHPQVNAPGYPMYYVWMIRHLDGNPWTERIYDPAHEWLL